MIGDPDLPRHGIHPDVLDDLMRGGGGATAAREIAAAQYSKSILMIQFLVRRAEALGHPHAAIARAAYCALTEFRRKHPAQFFAILRNPTVLAWSSRAARNINTNPGIAEPGLLNAVAAALALRCGAAARLELPPGSTGWLALPTIGHVRIPGAPGGALRLEAAAGRAVLTRDGREVPAGRGEPPSADWRPAVWLGAADGVALGPLRLTDDLRAVDVTVWRDLFQRAGTVLRHRHRVVAEELDVVLRLLCPIDAPAGGMTSGTYHDAFGAIVTSLPDGPRIMALTLAHELQHNKLVAIDHLLPLIRPGCRELFYAPWRDDPRPLIGLVHGLYAHVGVVAFWRGELEAGLSGREQRQAEVEYARWWSASSEVAAVLRDNPWLTPDGQALVRALDARIRGWAGRPLSTGAVTAADARRARHRARWIDRDKTARDVAG